MHFAARACAHYENRSNGRRGAPETAACRPYFLVNERPDEEGVGRICLVTKGR
jgi:hypothetical protein